MANDFGPDMAASKGVEAGIRTFHMDVSLHPGHDYILKRQKTANVINLRVGQGY